MKTTAMTKFLAQTLAAFYVFHIESKGRTLEESIRKFRDDAVDNGWLGPGFTAAFVEICDVSGVDTSWLRGTGE